MSAVYNGVEIKGRPLVTAKTIARHIVSDPEICHGKLTFRGTRVLVADVLEQVAMGMAWDSIAEEWRGSVTKEAIAEAVRLASQALLEHTGDLGAQPASA